MYIERFSSSKNPTKQSQNDVEDTFKLIPCPDLSHTRLIRMFAERYKNEARDPKGACLARARKVSYMMFDRDDPPIWLRKDRKFGSLVSELISQTPGSECS